MGTLDRATRRTCVQALDVLESLAGHLPVTLLHVRGLLLRHRAQDRLPQARQQAGDAADRFGDSSR